MLLVYFTVYKLHRYTESYIEWDIDMHSLFHVYIISFNLPYIFLLYTSLGGALKRLYLTSYPDHWAFMIQFALRIVFNKRIQPQIFHCTCALKSPFSTSMKTCFSMPGVVVNER